VDAARLLAERVEAPRERLVLGRARVDRGDARVDGRRRRPLALVGLAHQRDERLEPLGEARLRVGGVAGALGRALDGVPGRSRAAVLRTSSATSRSQRASGRPPGVSPRVVRLRAHTDSEVKVLAGSSSPTRN
jgi:hypothetical protein